MGFYTNNTDKKSGDGLAITEWNDLSNAVAGNSGLTLALNSADKVGIGTNQPTAKLEINGTLSVTDNVGIGTTASSAQLEVSGNVKATKFIGGTLSVTNNAEVNGTLSVTGNVGIGTTTPATKLEVSGDIKATRFIGDGSQLTNLSVGATGLNLATENGSKVGIGTATPAAKLHVAGDLRVSGDIVKENDWGITVGGSKATQRIRLGELKKKSGVYGEDGLNLNSNTNEVSVLKKLTVGDDLIVIGSLYVTNLPKGDKKNVQWDENSKGFWHDDSSRRHKENIIPLEDEFFKILEVAPKTYTRPGRPGEWEIGYIAEEFHELGLNKLVYYEKDGHPGAINYTKACMYLIEVVKNLTLKIEALNS